MKPALLSLALALVCTSARAEDARPVVDANKLPAGPAINPALPTLHIVGDSTVRAGGSGKGMIGWGERITPLFDTRKINVVNHALGGRSARTYFNEGRWTKVANDCRKGDFVILQFGHNDGGRVGDPANKGRADGPGFGDEVIEDTKADGTKEQVHSFGWYMGRMATEARDRGAAVIICSPVPHKQRWEKDRDFANFADWDQKVAAKSGASFIDLTLVVTKTYRKAGRAQVETFFADKGTHTTETGAVLNARCVVAGIKALPNHPLAGFLSPEGQGVDAYKP